MQGRARRPCKRKRRTKDTMNERDGGKTYKIDEKELLEEILLFLREDFSCTMVQEGGRGLLTFENGQRYLLTVREV